MRLIGIDIQKLNTFQFSDIFRLQATFDTDLQLIIGTNGSGKTNLMRQLSLIPPLRSDYAKDGSKTLLIHHGNSTIELTSDFKNKDKPHSFKLNDVELNISGNTSIQEELLSKHLNYSKTIDDILFNRLSITKMRPGERKLFFMNTNPCDIGFMLEYQKKIASKIKGYLTTTKVLTSSKVDLESKMISVDETKAYEKTKKFLETEIEYFIKSITEINTILKLLQSTSSTQSTESVIEKLSQLRRSLNLSMLYLKDVDKNQIINQNQNPFILQQTEINVKIRLLTEQIIEVKDQINNISSKLSECTDDELYKEYQLRINKYISHIDDLKNCSTKTPIDKEYLDLKNVILEKLVSLLDPFKNGQYIYFYNSRKIMAKQFQCSLYSNKILQLEDEQLKLKDRLNELEKIDQYAPPTTPCAKSNCPLYNTYMKKLNTIAPERAHINTRLCKIEELLKKYTSFIYLLKNQLIEIGNIVTLITPIFALKKEYPFISPAFNSHTLTSLKADYLYLYRSIEDLFIRSENYYDILNTENKLLTEKNKFSNKNILLLETKHRLEADLEKNQLKYRKLYTAHTELSEKLHLVEKFIYHTTILKQTYDELKNYIENVIPKHLKEKEEESNVKILIHMRNVFEERKNNNLTQLTYISSTLDQQKSIEDRYNNTVLPQLASVENDRKELSLIHKAVLHIPIQHTVAYINKIIEIMNFYVRIIFTYPFVIQPIKYSDTLDYKLSVSIDDSVMVPDVMMCSEAQSEIVDMAFNLAVRTILGYCDYPLYLDEWGSSFDPKHRERLILLIQYLLERNVVSQIFMINHHAVVHESFAHTQTLVLNDKNILVPEKYNEHVIFNKK